MHVVSDPLSLLFLDAHRLDEQPLQLHRFLGQRFLGLGQLAGPRRYLLLEVAFRGFQLLVQPRVLDGDGDVRGVG